MGKYYCSEQNAQIVIALLKANGIRKVVASPGATNYSFVGSLQNDPFSRYTHLLMSVRLHISPADLLL